MVNVEIVPEVVVVDRIKNVLKVEKDVEIVEVPVPQPYDRIVEVEKIIEKNECNDKIKQEIQVYINLFVEIFAETEKEGLGDVSPHFQKIEG